MKKAVKYSILGASGALAAINAVRAAAFKPEKKDLCAAAGISHASMAKLGKNENVTTDVLVKICTALQCDIGDIMELTHDSI